MILKYLLLLSNIKIDLSLEFSSAEEYFGLGALSLRGPFGQAE